MPPRDDPGWRAWVEKRLEDERAYLEHVAARKSKYPGVRKMHAMQKAGAEKTVRYLERELKSGPRAG